MNNLNSRFFVLWVSLTALMTGFGLSACSTVHESTGASLKEAKIGTGASTSNKAALELVDLLIGSYATLATDQENHLIDRKILLSKSPDTGAWIYYQLNNGEDKKLYRQRFIHLSQIDDERVLQKVYTPRDLAKWEDAWDKPQLLADFAHEDLQPTLADGCDQVWTKISEYKWRGYVDPKTCKIFSKRRQKNILVEGEAVLSQNQLLQTERGFDENGDQIWGSEPNTFITLERL